MTERELAVSDEPSQRALPEQVPAAQPRAALPGRVEPVDEPEPEGGSAARGEESAREDGSEAQRDDGSSQQAAHGEGTLGSIFAEDDAARAGKPRGPDLRVTVDVPRDALGDPDGFRAPIATQLEHEGQLVPRKVNPDDGDSVPLHLPDAIRPGTVLRLRGQGGIAEDGAAGDLYVKVNVVEPTSTSRMWPTVLLAVLAAGLAVSALVWALTLP